MNLLAIEWDFSGENSKTEFFPMNNREIIFSGSSFYSLSFSVIHRKGNNGENWCSVTNNKY